MKAFVITRDRLSYTQQCVRALLNAGLQVKIIDHGSTYPPMVEWLDVAHLERPDVWVYSPPSNKHPRDLWVNGTLAALTDPGERFIVTDCDVIPSEHCPPYWVDRLSALLDAHPGIVKVGLSLRTDDIPECYEHRERVQRWEAQYQDMRTVVNVAGMLAYRADVDTTLAMYRGVGEFSLGPALRTTPPYEAQHLAWYEDSAKPTEEQRWYREHANQGASTWLDPKAFAEKYEIDWLM